jgi:uncharacterized protein
VNSLDTNILVYAANEDCPEHARALAVVNAMLAKPGEWILADQVLWEYYKAQRNPKIFTKPRSASQASRQLEFLRETCGMAHCAYETTLFRKILRQLERPAFPYQRTHDAVLGATLVHHGVSVFYTRNTKDFADCGFARVVNPIDS